MVSFGFFALFLLNDFSMSEMMPYILAMCLYKLKLLHFTEREGAIYSEKTKLLTTKLKQLEYTS